jgi:hypothetical protein
MELIPPGALPVDEGAEAVDVVGDAGGELPGWHWL